MDKFMVFVKMHTFSYFFDFLHLLFHLFFWSILTAFFFSAPFTHKKLWAQKKLPLWELGAGIVSFRAHHYRGSDQEKTYTWPVPYFVYRGEFVRADNSGLQSRFLGLKKFNLGMSFSLGLPVESENNRAREGMPNLDPIIEFGPRLIWDIWSERKSRYFLSLEIPLRLATAIGSQFSLRQVGTFSVPYLSFVANPKSNSLGLFMAFSAAIMFGSKSYHNYYYGVGPLQQTPERRAYEAPGGHSGYHYTAFISKRFSHFQLYGFFRYDDLRSAVFSESPLVKRKSYTLSGLGFMWYFAKSSKVQRSREVR